MTTTKTSSTRLDRPTKFLESLHLRINNDNGAKAVFKRALSGEGRHIRNTYSMVLSYLEGIHERQQEVWIFVASLSVYYPQSIREKQQNFGSSCRGLANHAQSEGADRRFRALLDTSLEDIQSPLTALVRQIKRKEVRIDYPQLLADLCQWEHPNQYIQDNWARAFWIAASGNEEQKRDEKEG
ncbi:MAG: type I-E CRISPR-associated protein Cse2/CasB [Acaryochloridaceae cyanobacterium RU_4_10]|nr:type I-E CRISPR-associated protein Cse2/CasB [Acaryochloridaceae cyanobacterium RU_4_10]